MGSSSKVEDPFIVVVYAGNEWQRIAKFRDHLTKFFHIANISEAGKVKNLRWSLSVLENIQHSVRVEMIYRREELLFKD